MIKISYCADTRDPKRRCKAKEIIKNLLDDDKLPKTVKAMAQADKGGRSRKVAVSFMAELIAAGESGGWVWVEGQVKEGVQSWLEYDGWAVDLSNSVEPTKEGERNIVILDTDLYRKAHKIIKLVKRRTPRQTVEWISKRKKQMESTQEVNEG